MTIPKDITYLVEMRLLEFYSLTCLLKQIALGEPASYAEMQLILHKLDEFLERTMVAIVKDAVDCGTDMTGMNDPRADEFLKKHNIRGDGWSDVIGE